MKLRLLAPLLLLNLAVAASAQIRFEDLDRERTEVRSRLEAAVAAGDQAAIDRLRAELTLLEEGAGHLEREAEATRLRRSLSARGRTARQRERELELYLRVGGGPNPDPMTEADLSTARSAVDEASATLERLRSTLRTVQAERTGLPAAEAAILERRAAIASDILERTQALAAAPAEERPLIERRLAILRFEDLLRERQLAASAGRREYLESLQPIVELEVENAEQELARVTRRLERWTRQWTDQASQAVADARQKLESARIEEEAALGEGRTAFETLLLGRLRLLAAEELERAIVLERHQKASTRLKAIADRERELETTYDSLRQEYESIETLGEAQAIVLTGLVEELRGRLDAYERDLAPRIRALLDELRAESRAVAETLRRARRLEEDFQADFEMALRLHEEAGPDATVLQPAQWRKVRRDRIDNLHRLATARAELIAEIENEEQALTSYGDRLRDLVDFFEDKRLWLRESSQIDRESLVRAAGDLRGLPGAAVDYVRSVPDRLDWANRRILDRLGFLPVAVLLVLACLLVLHRLVGHRWLAARRELWTAKRHRSAVLSLATVLIARLETAPRLGIALGVQATLVFLLGVDGPTSDALLVALAAVYAYLQARQLLGDLLATGEDSQRILHWVDDDLADRVAGRIRRILALSLFFVPLGIALDDLGYENPGLLEAWGRTFEILLAILAIHLLVGGRALHLLVPPGQTAGRQALRVVLSLAGPTLAALIAFVLWLDVIGYRALARHLAFGSTWSAVTVVGFVVLGATAADLVARRLRRTWQRQPTEGLDRAARDMEQARQAFILRLSRLAILWLSVVCAVVLIGGSFGYDPDELHEILQRPLTTFADGDTLSIWNLIQAFVYIYGSVRLAEILRGIERFYIFPRTRTSRGAKYTLEVTTRYVIVGTGSILAIMAIHLDLSDLQWFLAAAGVGIGFGLQELIANFVSGLVLLVERPIQVGDLVDINGSMGHVQEITIRATTIRTLDNNSLILPNKHFIVGDVLNLSHGSIRIRREIRIGVAYGSDLSLVRKVLKEVVARDGRILVEPSPEVYLVGFGDSSIDFVVQYWPDPNHILPWSRLPSDILLGAEAAFRRQGITIPFPQRDLHLRSVDSDLLSALGRQEVAPEPPPPEPPPEDATAR